MHDTNHYGNQIECIEAMEQCFGADAVKDFCLLNAFKYLWRCRQKNQFNTDIRKAIDYLKYLESKGDNDEISE